MKTRPGEASGERNRQFGQGEAWSGYSLLSTGAGAAVLVYYIWMTELS